MDKDNVGSEQLLPAGDVLAQDPAVGGQAISLTTSDLALKCKVMHQPRTSLMAAAVKLASSSVSDSVMIRGGPRSTRSPSRPSAHPVEE